MDNKNLHIPIKALEQRFKSVIIRLPAIAGNEAINFILDNFKKQGFQGATFQPWRKRKDPNKWGQSPKRKGRNILIDAGMLRRSWRVIRSSQEMVVVGSDDPKAKAHNEGFQGEVTQNVGSYTRKKTKFGIVKKKEFKITFGRRQTGESTVKAHSRKIKMKIPKRQMIGHSPYLNARIQRLIGAEILKALKR